MSSWIRSSLRKKGSRTHGLTETSELSGKIIAETFERHWHQLRGIAALNTTIPSLDDVLAVVNLLDQMIALIQMELSSEVEDALSLEEGEWNPDGPLSLSDSNSPCLDILLSENIPAHILAASRMPLLPEQQDKLRAQQFKLYETLLGGSSLRAKNLLSHQPFLKPLIDLLTEFAADPGSEDEQETRIDYSSVETELHLVMFLNLLCSRLMEKDNEHLLEVFFNVDQIPNGSNKHSPQFLIFSILVNFLHRDGLVGQHARDALLLVMSLSKKVEKVGQHIAKNTNFCPILATGLSGLYSLLPRRLDDHPNLRNTSWYQISQSDLTQLPEVVNFLSSLRFCDAVVQVAHPSVRQHLLGLIYMGFLVPVLGPALTQSVESELICSTAYVDLFLRQISEPALLAVFLRFIFTDKCDGKNIIDILINRLALQSQLCLVTLSLFDTLVSLNCEDVMLWLVFRHLIPMQHLLPSQKSTIRQPDLLGRGAEKLLSMMPICCTESRSAHLDAKDKGVSGSLPTFLVGMGRPHIEDGIALDSSEVATSVQTTSLNEVTSLHYSVYLQDARKIVRQRYNDTKCWMYEYDGISPPPWSVKLEDRSFESCDIEATLVPDHFRQSPVEGSTPQLTDEEIDRDFWNMMKDASTDSSVIAEAKKLQSALKILHGDSVSLGSESLSLSPTPDDSSPAQEALELSTPCGTLGTFLDVLLEKVELMSSNSLSMNLLVTSVISQLASYPQPLLRSVLIHPDVILQPSVRGLFSAIASLRQKLDNIMPTLIGGEEAVQLARKFLAERLDESTQKGRRDSNVSIMSSISHLGHEARATKSRFSDAFSSMFRRRSNPPSEQRSPVTHETSSVVQTGRRSVQFASRRLSREVRQHALAAVILEEWLQELAAIAHEQSLLQKEQAEYQLSLATSLEKAITSTAVEGQMVSVNKATNLLTSSDDASTKETRS